MKHEIYTNQTGKFPVASRRGHKYLMIMCKLDINKIIVETMKTKTEEEMISTHQNLLNRLKERVVKTKRHILNNEISDAYKEKIKGNGIQYELLSSGMQLRNLSGKRIKNNFKGHFKSLLCRVDNSFQLELWGRIIKQTEMKINLLWQANKTLKVSAYA